MRADAGAEAVIRIPVWFCAVAVAFTFAHPAAAQQPTAVPAGKNAPAVEPEPDSQPVTMKKRAYLTLRFGRMGRSELETSEGELAGTPNHVLAFGSRGELPLMPNLVLGYDLLVSGVTGADLTEHGKSASLEYAPIDLGALLAPRLPLVHGLVEARVQLMFGLSLITGIHGEFPITGQGANGRYAFSERAVVGGYFGAGLGATYWLNGHWSAFVELDLLHRAAGATVKPGLQGFPSFEPQPESHISITETFGALSFGIGYSSEGP